MEPKVKGCRADARDHSRTSMSYSQASACLSDLEESRSPMRVKLSSKQPRSLGLPRLSHANHADEESNPEAKGRIILALPCRKLGYESVSPPNSVVALDAIGRILTPSVGMIFIASAIASIVLGRFMGEFFNQRHLHPHPSWCALPSPWYPHNPRDNGLDHYPRLPHPHSRYCYRCFSCLHYHSLHPNQDCH